MWKGGRYDKEFKGSANTAHKNFFKSKDAEKKKKKQYTCCIQMLFKEILKFDNNTLNGQMTVNTSINFK